MPERQRLISDALLYQALLLVGLMLAAFAIFGILTFIVEPRRKAARAIVLFGSPEGRKPNHWLISQDHFIKINSKGVKEWNQESNEKRQASQPICAIDTVQVPSVIRNCSGIRILENVSNRWSLLRILRLFWITMRMPSSRFIHLPASGGHPKHSQCLDHSDPFGCRRRDDAR